ncbi:MAG: bacteriohemerythrin [Pseudomonadota bacterium]
MALIAWREEFEIGIPSVDYEHRRLVDQINGVAERLASGAGEEAVLDALGEIHGTISAHFALEEQVMRDLGYDEFAAHKADHERLLDDIRDISDAFEHGAYANAQDVLDDHLSRWFTEHFRSKDARLHKFLAQAGATAFPGGVEKQS